MPTRVQDILPNDRRSIRDVPVSREKPSMQASPLSRTPIEKKMWRGKESPRNIDIKGKDISEIKIHKLEEKKPQEPMRRMPMTPPPTKKKRFHGRKGLWLLMIVGIVAVVVVAGFLASTYFAHAVFTITPKISPIAVNSTLTIKPGVTNDLSYDVITMRSKDSITVPAKDGPIVSTKASGSVTVYNEYSASSVRLIAGTRLSDDGTRIYRLKSSVVIPGYKKTSGTVVPGTLTTTVEADQAGPDYNISKSGPVSDFKIVAYKGTDKYETIYARAASDLSGGATGIKKAVASTVLASTTAAIKAALLADLLSKTKAAVPADYILYDNAYTSQFSEPTIEGTIKDSADVSVDGVVYGIIFKKSDLVSKLVKSSTNADALSRFGTFGYTAPGLESLSFNISNIKDFAPDKKGTLIVSLKGDMKLIGTVPVEIVKKSLAGKSLADSQAVLRTFSPVIENADGELVPPWSKIPTDTSRITINLTL